MLSVWVVIVWLEVGIAYWSLWGHCLPELTWHSVCVYVGVWYCLPQWYWLSEFVKVLNDWILSLGKPRSLCLSLYVWLLRKCTCILEVTNKRSGSTICPRLDLAPYWDASSACYLCHYCIVPRSSGEQSCVSVLNVLGAYERVFFPLQCAIYLPLLVWRKEKWKCQSCCWG